MFRSTVCHNTHLSVCDAFICLIRHILKFGHSLVFLRQCSYDYHDCADCSEIVKLARNNVSHFLTLQLVYQKPDGLTSTVHIAFASENKLRPSYSRLG